jgi:hypothetical protein
VRAKIRNLQARNWAYDETDILNPQAVKDEKRDVRYQLLSEIPDNARDLAYRLYTDRNRKNVKMNTATIISKVWSFCLVPCSEAA